ncbi:hypothetical protein A0J61_07068 [Choanephora cucurbitarum]|uniref:Uncharacterized protein n=1 Tax=Choanephora cucurbitarum TaxID=101091 RepID=A0A1C7N738_9FUNG|nr:hypothetical protein A0J61_07068 [Choanephora cucurbitarum]
MRDVETKELLQYFPGSIWTRTNTIYDCLRNIAELADLDSLDATTPSSSSIFPSHEARDIKTDFISSVAFNFSFCKL